MDKQKLFIAGGIGLAIALLVGNSASANPSTGSETDDVPEVPKSTTTAPAGGSGFPLKRGSKGQYVRNLQQWLGVTIDGIFGAGTEAALKKRTNTTSVVSLAALNALLAGATLPVQSGGAVLSVGAAEPLAASLFTACYAVTKEPILSYGLPEVVVGYRTVSRFRTTPDYDTILRILNARSDGDLRTISGVWMAKYSKITSGGFGHTLDHWNSTALRLYGLWTLRVKLSALGL